MSYPNIAKNLAAAGLDPNTASDEQLTEVLWQTLREDLPDGIYHLEDLATKSLSGQERVIDVQDPNSALGKQLIRLVGTDIARNLCEQRLGVALGFYNCCVTVAAPKKADLRMNIREQISFQNGVLASADC